MVRPARRRAKSASVAKKKKEEDYVDDDDDDDDEEEDDYEFVPGHDDDDDEDEDEHGVNDGNESVAGILEGHLYYDETEHVLHYQGDAFHLTANMKHNSNTSVVVWNPLRDPPPSSHMATYQMKGTIKPPGMPVDENEEFNNDDDDDEEEEDAKKPSKLPLRIFDITWSIQHDGAPLVPNHHDLKSCPGKSCPAKDDEEDGKQKASPKRPALFYHVVGREVESATHENVLIQFQGGFYPLPLLSQQQQQSGKEEEEEEEELNRSQKAAALSSSTITSSVPLNCQFQYVLDNNHKTAAAAAIPAAAAPAMAAVAAAAVGNNNNDDDDDDEEADADEGLGYDELIALHEDAGMNVEELKRRYHNSNTTTTANNDNDDEDGKQPSSKKFKSADEDDDDDDDVGF